MVAKSWSVKVFESSPPVPLSWSSPPVPLSTDVERGDEAGRRFPSPEGRGGQRGEEEKAGASLRRCAARARDRGHGLAPSFGGKRTAPQPCSKIVTTVGWDGTCSALGRRTDSCGERGSPSEDRAHGPATRRTLHHSGRRAHRPPRGRGGAARPQDEASR